jgi:tRNA-dihydrouridine synthase B
LVKIGNKTLGEFPLLLAPMEDITDSPFRTICKGFGVDVLITEFISSEGLIRDAGKSKMKMSFREEERPLGIQIFGHSVDSMQKATEMAEAMNPDFIDINFGCPFRKVVMKGGGAALLNDLPKMTRMTETVVKSTSLPVTVKTRLGWDEKNKNILEIAERLQDVGIQAITIHGRTRTQLYGGKADWTLIGEVKKNPRITIPVFGNGDVTSAIVAAEMKERYGIDGIMIGRSAIGNPWIFRETKAYLEKGELIDPPVIAERIKITKIHLRRSIEYKGEIRTVFELRKFYNGYFKGIPDFKKYRMRLVTASTIEDIYSILGEIEMTSPPGPLSFRRGGARGEVPA